MSGASLNHPPCPFGAVQALGEQMIGMARAGTPAAHATPEVLTDRLTAMAVVFSESCIGACVGAFVEAEMDTRAPEEAGEGAEPTAGPVLRFGRYFGPRLASMPEREREQLSRLVYANVLSGYIGAALLTTDIESIVDAPAVAARDLYDRWTPAIDSRDVPPLLEETAALAGPVAGALSRYLIDHGVVDEGQGLSAEATTILGRHLVAGAALWWAHVARLGGTVPAEPDATKAGAAETEAGPPDKAPKPATRRSPPVKLLLLTGGAFVAAAVLIAVVASMLGGPAPPADAPRADTPRAEAPQPAPAPGAPAQEQAPAPSPQAPARGTPARRAPARLGEPAETPALPAPPAARPVWAVKGSRRRYYHRPECSYVRRLAPPERLVFDSVESAEGDGYVACRRCRPADPDHDPGKVWAGPAGGDGRYHLPSCRQVRRLKPGERRVFPSAGAAGDAGLKPCPRCLPAAAGK